MISKVIIIISIFSFIIIIGLLIYFLKKNHKHTNSTPNSDPDHKRCKGDICNDKCCDEGWHCQSDNQTCCKDELWGVNEDGFSKCCNNPLCGKTCCDEGHACGVDKNNNPVCCKDKLCGTNNLCCSLTGEDCQEDGTCCHDKFWDKNKKKCCKKPLCNGNCCEDTEQCNSDTGLCIPCADDLCNGKCCKGNQICRECIIDGVVKNNCNCCDQPLCGTNCCEDSETCLTDFSCCKIPCGEKIGDDGKPIYTSCCKDPNKPYCNGDTCCSDDLKCKDEANNPVCNIQGVCGKLDNGECLCCNPKLNQVFDQASKKCKTSCGKNSDGTTTLCDPDTQVCEFIYDKDNKQGYWGCVTNTCVWDSQLNEYDPIPISNKDPKTQLSAIIPTCVTPDKKYYTINDPKDYKGNPIPLSDLSRKVFITEKSNNQCGISDCYKKLNESGITMVGIDDTTKPIQCKGIYNCDKLLPIKEAQCPLTDAPDSCCNVYDSNGNFVNFTGQICPPGQPCYNNTCYCAKDQEHDPVANNCTVRNRSYCHGNGDPNFHNGKCDCDIDKSTNLPIAFGDLCNFDKDTLCHGRGMPRSATECNCDPKYWGPKCEVDIAQLCNGHGTPVSDTKCSCETGYTGDNCNCQPDYSCTDITLNKDKFIYFGSGTIVDNTGTSGNNCQCGPGTIFNNTTNKCDSVNVNDVNININFVDGPPIIDWWIAYVILLPGLVVNMFDLPSTYSSSTNPKIKNGTLGEDNYLMDQSIANYKNKPIPVKMSMFAYKDLNANKPINLSFHNFRTETILFLSITADNNGNITLVNKFANVSKYTNYKIIRTSYGTNNFFNYILLGNL